MLCKARPRQEHFSARPSILRIVGKQRTPRFPTHTHKPCSRKLEGKEKTKPTTVRRHADILELRNGLSKSLRELRESQRVYMPGLVPLLEDDESVTESSKMWLPSELSKDEQLKWCLAGIPALEFRFRYAQADDSLAEIRRLRRMLQGLHNQNSKHHKLTQRSITRTKGLFESFQVRIRRAVSRYRHSREAMVGLDPSQELSPRWMLRFQILDDSHVRGPAREDDELSNGTFQPTWIWLLPRLTSSSSAKSNAAGPAAVTNPPPGSNVVTNPPPSSDVITNLLPDSDAVTNPLPNSNIAADGPVITATENQEVAQSMRAHWAKCQARADRYEEEVTLTVEEMGRTLRYFEWKKTFWLSCQASREKLPTPPPTEVCQGLRAYAYRQADVYETLIALFVKRWKKVLVPNSLGAGWLSRYPDTPDLPSLKKPRVQPDPTTRGPKIRQPDNIST